MPVTTTNDIKDLEALATNQLNGLASRFGGTEDSLLRTANQADLSERLTDTRARTDKTFDSIEGSLGRSQRGLGLSLSDRQKKSQTRRLSLSRAIAQADASGGVRRGSEDLAKSAFRSGAGLEDGLAGIEFGGLTQLANAEGQRRVNQSNKNAAKRARRDSFLGTAASIILSSKTVKTEVKKDESVLDKLKTVGINKWRYKGDDQDHIGPYAEEFNDAFGVNQVDRRRINLSDAVGIQLGALKELNEKVEALANG